MTPAEYSVLALRTQADQEKVRKRIYDYGTQATQIENGARGLASDAGEVLACVQRWLEYGKPLDPTNLLEELGDVAWRMNQIMNAMGWTWEMVFKANIGKLSKRFPDGFSDFLAAEENRNREEEAKAVTMSLDGMTPHEPTETQKKMFIKCAREGVLDGHVTSTQSVGLPKVGDPYPPEPRQQTGQGWAEPSLHDLVVEMAVKKLMPKPEVYEDNLWDKDPTIGDVVTAIQRGWKLNEEKDTPALYLPGDESTGWAARWLQVQWRGLIISVPHWLPRRLHEIEEEKQKGAVCAQVIPIKTKVTRTQAQVKIGGFYYDLKLDTDECGEHYVLVQPKNDSSVPRITEPAASFGDGLVRPKTLSSSYDRFCTVCNRNTIHRNNTCGMCPNCMANQKAAEAELVRKGQEEKAAE